MLLKISTILNGGTLIVLSVFNLRMLWFMKWKYFQRWVSWIDIAFSFTNVAMISIIVHDQFQPKGKCKT